MRFFTLALAAGALALAAPTATLAAEQVHPGQQIFLKNKCSKCHAMEGAGIALDKSTPAAGEEADDGAADTKKDAPDLTRLDKATDGAWLDLYLQKKESLDGKKHKKRFKGTEDERKALVEWLLSFPPTGGK